MTFLSILLSLTMTFTIQSKSSVSFGGVYPNDITADYSSTYQKGDVRAGDTAKLSLRGLENIRLEKVHIYIRSNKSTGAGILIMIADGTSLYEQSGTYQDWYGEYNNAEYQPIGWSGNKVLVNGTLDICLVGTINSLHIEKYEIEYSNLPPELYSVTLHCSEQEQVMKETSIGSGMVLPKCDDRTGWYFIGWSKIDVKEITNDDQTIMQAGYVFYPKTNCELWAVWSSSRTHNDERQIEPESGYYLMSIDDRWMSGIAQEGKVALTNNSSSYLDNIYYLDFAAEDSTMTIYNCEKGTYLGYNKTYNKLENIMCPWHYSFMADSTWLIYSAVLDNGDYCVLYSEIGLKNATIQKFTSVKGSTQLWSLYSVSDPYATPLFWSHPWPLDTNPLVADEKEYIVPIGIYELRVKSGKKSLRLR